VAMSADAERINPIKEEEKEEEEEEERHGYR
jgi:hypothetical protein